MANSNVKGQEKVIRRHGLELTQVKGDAAASLTQLKVLALNCSYKAS
ncbi:hypothetical protein ACRAVF_00940 [Bradyrhizobium oligotrophicum S58]